MIFKKGIDNKEMITEKNKEKNIKKRPGNILFAFALVLILVFAVGCDQKTEDAKDAGKTESAKKAEENSGENAAEKFQYTDFVMDTVLSETIYGQENCSKEIQDILASLEEKELSWRISDSEAAQINKAFKEGKSYDLSEEFETWISATLELAEKSEGAFDPTIGELTRLWNIEGENPTVPPKEKIEDCLKEIGYDKVHIKDHQIYIEETRTIDLGAAGKGIACDEAADYLEQNKTVKGAVVAVGGSILTYGEKPDGEPWAVAVQTPDGEDGQAMGVIRLSGTNYISTSGDYEKYFEQDGKRYHHILDPHTGYPSESDLSSVTIVCDNGLLSDGLSTACYVLGEEKALALLKEYDAEGIFIDHEGKVTVTDGLLDSFEILDGNYSYK